MYRDFQFYDSRIVDYTRIGETLTLFFRNSSRTASVVTPEHWRRIQGWEG